MKIFTATLLFQVTEAVKNHELLAFFRKLLWRFLCIVVSLTTTHGPCV